MPALSGSQKAYKFAQSGVIRSGSSRSNYTSGFLFVSIAGVAYATGRASSANAVLLENISIVQNLDDIPDTCSFTLRGAVPLNGQEVLIGLGSKSTYDLLFGGVIMMPTSIELKTKPTSVLHQVTCTDFTWMLTRHKINKRYLSTSATAIVLDIMTGAPVGFTTYGVQAGLPTVDEFTVTNETRLDALRRLAKRIGGYVDISPLKDVRFGTSDQSGTNPTTITSTHPTLMRFSLGRDMSQMVTRAIGEGGGGNALSDVLAGDTIIPVDNIVWYNAHGGLVTCGPQRIAYTQAVALTGGSLVGPGATPSAPPTVGPFPGTGITAGAHSYAYTFVTGSGESLPSPLANYTTFTLAAPSAGPSIDQTVTNRLGTLWYITGDTVDRVVTYSAQPTGEYPYTHETAASPTTTVTAVGGTGGAPRANPDRVTYAHSADANVTYIRLWRRVNGGQWQLLRSEANLPGETTDLYDDLTPQFSIASLPTANTDFAQAALSNIAAGPSGTTQRKVYRTAVGSSQLKLLATIADNTTTTNTDSTADGSLGANVPTSDTSGLTQPSGQVSAGSTTLLTAGAGAFSSAGGWAVIGNGQQVIRYTGISTNTLTGIPASGTGAILATVPYNSVVTPAPCLSGIPTTGDGAIAYALNGGDPVNLVVIVDDLAAQAYLASLIGGTEDGVIEDGFQDGRLSETEVRARATAMLALRGALNDGVQITSRDWNTRAGRTVTVSLSTPISLSDSFKIQTATITWETTKSYPFFTATASDQRYTFEDLVRQLQTPQN